MSQKSFAALALLAVLTAAGSTAANAGPAINTTRGAVLVDGKSAPGLAVHGYDVVAYFTDGKPVRGESKFSVIHDDASYRFASQEHSDAFKANPGKYLPAYGGYCAFGVSVGAKFDGDPLLWKIVEGRLYLNLDPDIAAAFNKDVAGALRKAEANWPKLSGQPSK